MRRECRLPLLLLLFFLLGPLLVQDPTLQNRQMLWAPPSLHHWFGTDDYGRDIFSRFVVGGRTSLLFGLGAASACLGLGWSAGAMAALWPRAAFLLAVADLFMVLPWVYLLLAARVALPLELPGWVAFLFMLLVLAFTGWGRPARLVAARITQVKDRGYVAAARQFGVPPVRLFFRHILPATYDLLLAQSLLLFPKFVLAQVTLSFLGVASLEPSPSWGSLIFPLRQVYLLNSHRWLLLPLGAMAPFFSAFAVCGRRLENNQSLIR